MTDRTTRFTSGVTEAGTPSRGKIKSAAGVGALLLEDIGDTMRISLTADPVEEVLFAKELLAALGIRKDAIEIGFPVQHAAGQKWIWKRSRKA